MIRTVVPFFAFALAASVPALASETIPVAQFDAVGLEGGGTVTIVPGPRQRVSIVEGSSRFTRIYVEHQSLKIEACNRDCPQHYRLRVEVQSPRVPVLAVDGGGEIRVGPGFGAQHNLVAAVNGGGVIDTTAAATDVATAAVHGGGEIKVRALRALTAAVKGGGAIRYWGKPQVTTAIDGGGTVRPAGY